MCNDAWTGYRKVIRIAERLGKATARDIKKGEWDPGSDGRVLYEQSDFWGSVMIYRTMLTHLLDA
jgi:hypothetical protein